MSGETADKESGWTTDTLRAHVLAVLDERDERYTQRFKDQEAAVSAALAAAEKAVVKAETATEKRFEGVNEFRGQLADQARDLMPRKEFEAAMEGALRRIDLLEKTNDRNSGRSRGVSDSWGYLLGAAGLIAAVVAIVATR